MKLSVLIPTLDHRRFLLEPFLSYCAPFKDVEVLLDARSKETPTGTKRNDLMDSASGDYFIYKDDDDQVSEDYLPEILKAIEQNPDVITFEGEMTTNGAHKIDWVIKLGEKYEARTDHGSLKYFRFPNHLCAMKRELVKDVRFPDEWLGEDYAWAKKIKDLDLLKTEVHIEKKLYFYHFVSNKRY